MFIEKPRNRVAWIDVMKGICMVCVVISHSFPPTAIIRIYSPFFFFFFFFCSGYTFGTKSTFKEFFLSRIKSLIVPLVILSIINGVVGVVFKSTPFEERLLGIVLQQANGYESLWFIACLFTSELIFYLILRVSKTINSCFILCHLVGIVGFFYIRYVSFSLPWQLELACISVIFLSWGLLYRIKETIIDRKQINNNKVLIIVLLSIYIALCLLIDNDVNYHEKRFSNVFLFLLEALIGIYVLIYASKAICNKARFLAYIGTHSIIYFAFQGFLIVCLRRALVRIGVTSGFALSALSSTIAIPILTLSAYIIYNYFPFIVGQNWKNS